MNSFLAGNGFQHYSQASSSQTTSRTRKKQSTKQQLTSKQQQQIVILQQNNAQKGVKIKKDDLKLIQQYCDSNELGIIEANSNQIRKGLSGTQKGHMKTKSEGATPLASANYMKSHFAVKPNADFNMVSSNANNQVHDYQKFLEEEKLYPYPKSKSQMGYYSQVANNTGRLIPQSKSPDVNQYHSQGLSKRVGIAPQQQIKMVASANQSLISQSALSNYPNAQNLMAAQSRAMMTTSQGTRSSSRKASIPHPALDYPQSTSKQMNYNAIKSNSNHNLFMVHHPSTTSYKIKTSNSINRPVPEQYSLEAHMPDQLNESSVYMYDDPLLRSNNQIMITAKTNLGKYQSQHQHIGQDESYLDASLYDHFIQGPHNISQYSNSKGEQDQSYIQYLTRSVSQNQHQQQPQKFIMQSQSQKAHHTRSQSQYQNSQQAAVTKNKQTSNQTVQSSLNNSGNKNAHDRRMLMGRTPSPNFMKRLNGIMQLPPDSLILQQHLYQNQNTNTHKNIGQTTKRSISKQQFSTNLAASNTAKLMGSGTINQQMNKSLKQKMAKQYGTNAQVNRYKSGSITTSANTAQNSPTHNNRGTTPKRNSLKQKTIQTIQQQQQQLYHQQAELEALAETYKKQAYLNQVAMTHQNKLKKVNQDEEKRALAMISNIDNHISSKHNLSQQQSIQGYQFYQPMKIVGEIMEEDPQPLSSHEFINFEEIKLSQPEKIKRKRSQQLISKQGNSKKSFASPASNMYYDGGTGGNKINSGKNALLLSKNSILSNETQTYSQNPTQINPQNDQNQITQYLEQLQNKRQQQLVQKQTIQSPNQSQKNSIEQQPLHQYLANQYQSNQNPVRAKTPSNLIKMIDEDEFSPAANQEYIVSKYNRKNTQSVEPPKISTPNVDMFKQNKGDYDQKLKEHTNFQKKHQAINFQDKTPFEKELEQKALELKKKKLHEQNQKGASIEVNKMQIPQKDTITILKQLQDNENNSEDIMNESKVQQKQVAMKAYPKQLQPQLIPQQKQEMEVIQSSDVLNRKMSNKAKGPLNAKKYLDDSLQKFDQIQDERLITQEEEQQIKEVISDLNEKAFYGKIMKKTKGLDIEEFKNLSPRSREIANIMQIISQAFIQTKEPPVTTTDFYRIGKMLGRGAFGKVNLAMHKLVRKLVAIKSLNKECLTDEAQKAKLMKEVSLLLKLRHNHVVKIYETIETEKHIIIVMELCAGGDLLNYVRKRRRLKENYAKLIFKQIIDGLCYIHSKYIAHRDIKLDNILLDGKGNVKIADFGVSKQAQKGMKMTEQCGTPAYIAPEILKDKGYSFGVDIWSAGVVLFSMLYGTVPFKANNMEELHKLIVKGKYTLKDDISIEARNLLRGLLEVNPDKRLTISQIYRHKWFEDLDPNLQLFNDQERDQIKKEYTYNDPRRYNRNENEEPADCFTEHHIESVYNSLQNATSKSVILAPFNSTQSEFDPKHIESIHKMLCEKMMVLKFARRCREIDRQYEFNNNGDLDNGVYHNKVYNSDDQEDGDGNQDPDKSNNINNDLLSIPMLLSEKKKPPKRGGRASVENSFEDQTSIRQMQERQQLAKQIKQSSHIGKEMRNQQNIDKDLDNELVETYEEFQSRYSNKLDEVKASQIVQFGYPEKYVKKSLEEGDPNYCTAGYYLLCLDQNYC